MHVVYLQQLFTPRCTSTHPCTQCSALTPNRILSENLIFPNTPIFDSCLLILTTERIGYVFNLDIRSKFIYIFLVLFNITNLTTTEILNNPLKFRKITLKYVSLIMTSSLIWLKIHHESRHCFKHLFLFVHFVRYASGNLFKLKRDNSQFYQVVSRYITRDRELKKI